MENKISRVDTSSNKLKKNYLILTKRFNILNLAFKQSRIAFKKLLKNYLILKRKYLLLRKHSTSKVRALIDQINQEKYSIVISGDREVLNISDTFLETIDMSREEFTNSFYIDVLFSKYLPAITPGVDSVEVPPFRFPIIIKNYQSAENHLHPYMYFNVNGRLLIDKKYNKYFYQLNFTDVTASVELEYFQKTDTLVSSLSISNFNLSNAMKTIEMHKIMLIFLTCSLIEEYNRETSEHTLRIKEITTFLSEECRQRGLIHVEDYDLDQYVKDINFTSVLHDIGKMGIPNEILFKDGELTEEEKQIMRNHSRIGVKYIQKIIDFLSDKPGYSYYLKFLQIPYQICLYHHERWDGNGYPEGLSGKDIPIPARIVSVADTYDAIRGNRVYDKSRTHEEAVDIIKDEAGKQFDPEIVEAFLVISPMLKQIEYE